MNRPRKSAWKRLRIRLLHLVCRMAPGGGSFRVSLHRRRGVCIGEGVFIGEDVYIESEYPEAVEIQDGAQISMRCTIVAHTRGPGKVVIGRNAYIGVGCTIVSAANRTLTIGEGAVVMAGTVVSSSIPPYTLFGSERGKALARVTKPLPFCEEYMEFVRGLRPIEPNAGKEPHE